MQCKKYKCKNDAVETVDGYELCEEHAKAYKKIFGVS